MNITRLGKVALAFTAIAVVCVFTAFVTSSWLVTDGQLEKPKFENLGLWSVCFKNFEDERYWHDTKSVECFWVYQEKYYVDHEFLVPNFYIAVQFLFSICFILSLIAGFLTLAYVISSRHADNFICLLSLLGCAMLIAGISGTLTCISFVVYGDARSWMPHWEHNNMGYSFWVACVGTVSSYIAGLSFLAESRKRNIKRNFLYD